jgi:hypothetical protein
VTVVPALWTKHRHIARIEASEWHLPGSERQDVEQEALIALWQAARAALTRIIDGSPIEGKADDNLRYRVRCKLRAA